MSHIFAKDWSTWLLPRPDRHLPANPRFLFSCHCWPDLPCITTVMTVPNTCDGMLLNNLIQKEAQICKLAGYCIKLVEGNGVPLNRMFPAPISKDFCDRMDECSVCRLSSRASKCTVRSVVYMAECLQCWDVWYKNVGSVADSDEISETL